MHTLLGKYFNGETTAEENEVVQKWIEASDENRSDFQLLQKLWNKSGEREEIIFDTAKAWQSVNAKINTARTPARTVRMFTRRTAIGAAASVIVLLGLWWLIGLRADITVYADAAMKEVRLQDGSVVYLRKGATLTYPREFDENTREVSLQGEAFFDVTHNPAKPFRILAAVAAVEVVGTSFTVNANDDATELIVKTGRVKFGWSGNRSHDILVSAGERALLADGVLAKEVNTDANFNAWQSKQLVFSNTLLPQVVLTLSDYYNVKINLRKEDEAQLSVAELTAQFNNQSLAAVLEEIALITSYRVQRVSEGNYEISIK